MVDYVLKKELDWHETPLTGAVCRDILERSDSCVILAIQIMILRPQVHLPVSGEQSPEESLSDNEPPNLLRFWYITKP